VSNLLRWLVQPVGIYERKSQGDIQDLVKIN
jgi:hypothetical protein